LPAQVRNAAGSNSGSSTALTFAPVMPAGLTAGDLLLAIVRGSTAAVPSARPSGWTLVRNIADANFNMDVMWKQAAGGDTASWSAAVARKWAGTVIALITGTWDTGTPFDVENGVNHTAAAATLYTTPSVTVSLNDCLLVAAFGNRAASTWTTTNTNPTMLEAADTTASGSNPASASLYHSALNAVPLGAITRSATATVSSADACMWIGAIRPGGTPTPGKGAGQPVGTKRVRAQHRAASW
jgi:hypothetical protein